jgi:ribosomal protein S18 acetylase RimI-like enzyme
VIQRFEEISMSAWPALQTLLYDGWVLRFADGYTRRANSINPIYSSTIDVDEKIKYCHKLYDAKKLRAIFKITREVYPTDLDRILETNGFACEAETSVQIIDFCRIDTRKDSLIETSRAVDDRWLDSFFRMSKMEIWYKDTLRSMLENIIQPRCLASIQDGDSIVACGLGVMDERTVGLFDIVVDEDFRGKGFGRRVLDGILYWAKTNGAETAYLQVMVDNKNALALYQKLGFKELYRYWYRVKE